MDLITDRTKSDVLMQNEKGRYGIADLNRVESAVAELLAMLQIQLGSGLELEIKTDWDLPGTFSAETWPTERQMRRYLDNVNRLCQAVALAAELPATMEDLTWEGANQIERALESVYDRIQTILQTFRYSGEVFAGEEYGI